MATAREMAWMYAPTVNSYKRYQLASWAPTAIVWSRDNRTAGYRTVGEHGGFRVECRIPGADANPYLAFAATVASGMWGIENKIEPPPMFEGNAYEAKRVPRVPTSLHEAIDVFRKSKAAKEMFGDFVYGHLLNTAVQEQSTFDNLTVTDWELAPLLRAGLSTAMLEPALEAILRSVPGWVEAEFEVEPLGGGITNRNYVVTVDGSRYALRVPGHDTALLGIDRANEHRAAVVAAAVGARPEVCELLIHHYFLGDVLDRHRARLVLMTLMSDFREAMWGVVQQAISALDVDLSTMPTVTSRACWTAPARSRSRTCWERPPSRSRRGLRRARHRCLPAQASSRWLQHPHLHRDDTAVGLGT